MRLEQLKYQLEHKDENSKTLSPFSNGDIFLCLNGIKSSIKLEDIFTSIQSKTNDTIKGYSPLEFFLIGGSAEGKDLSTFALMNEAGQEIIVIDKDAPLWQWNDEDFEEGRYNKLVDELIRQCTPVEEPVVEEFESSETQGGKGDTKVSPVSEEVYNKYKNKFLKSGYKLKDEGNTHLFYMDDDMDDNILVIVDEDGVDFPDLIKVEDGIFKYEDEAAILMINKIGGEVSFHHNPKEIKQN